MLKYKVGRYVRYVNILNIVLFVKNSYESAYVIRREWSYKKP